jgi:Flp pilus assembly pilin Flp
MPTRFKQHVRQFIVDESGPTAIEYSLMLALIAGVLLAAVFSLGQFQNVLWIEMSADIENAIN